MASLLEQTCEDFSAPGALADHDARRVEVVVQRFAFAREFWGEDEVLCAKRFSGVGGVTHGHCGLDDHHCIRVVGHDVIHDQFDGPRIEVVGFGVVVGGCRDDDVVLICVGIGRIERSAEVQRLVCMKVLDFFVFDWGPLLVQQGDFCGDDVQRDYLVVLSQENGAGQANVAGAGNGSFHEDFFLRRSSWGSLTSVFGVSIYIFCASCPSSFSVRP